MFPIIKNDLQVRQALADKPEIRFTSQPNGATVCCYMVSEPGTFNSPFAREARGLTFSSKGEVISRPLHKFFNINQLPETQASMIDWSQVARVAVKRDGSMIHTVKATDNVKPIHQHAKFALKSKKSFTSDVVKACESYLASGKAGEPAYRGDPLIGYPDLFKHYINLGNMCVDNNMTAIFEFTSPIARIVLPYVQQSLTLLHIRDNVSGRYMDHSMLKAVAKAFDVPLVEDADDILRQLKFFKKPEDIVTYINFLVETTLNMEGWVFQLANGDMLKLKTKWYMDRHAAMTNLRIRDIAEMVINETVDDLKSKLVGDGINVSQLEEIEADVVRRFDEMVNAVEDKYTYIMNFGLRGGDYTKDDFADEREARKYFVEVLQKYVKDGYPYFKLTMQRYSGTEPSFKEHFLKYELPKFELTQINLLNSVAEADDV